MQAASASKGEQIQTNTSDHERRVQETTTQTDDASEYSLWRWWMHANTSEHGRIQVMSTSKDLRVGANTIACSEKANLSEYARIQVVSTRENNEYKRISEWMQANASEYERLQVVSTSKCTRARANTASREYKQVQSNIREYVRIQLVITSKAKRIQANTARHER